MLDTVGIFLVACDSLGTLFWDSCTLNLFICGPLPSCIIALFYFGSTALLSINQVEGH